MAEFFSKKILPFGIALGAIWLAVKYLFPVALPFLLGGAVALLAEPLVTPISNRLNRTVGAAVGVSLTLCVLAVTVLLFGAIGLRQVGRLAQSVPQLTQNAQAGLSTLQNWLTDLSDHAPSQLQPLLTRTVMEFFSDGNILIQQVTQYLPGAVGSAIGTVGNGIVNLGVGVLSAFFISSRLPKLRAYFSSCSWVQQFLPAARKVRTALGGWLKAQLKLCAVTWGIVSIGFLLLKIPHALAWAGGVAVVDAVPILGTGTVLIPWAVVSLLQGESLRAIGLFCTYGAAFMARTILEPKLVGNQLGLDPLSTLAALYVGYRFWGVGGLLLTPILASATKSLFSQTMD